MTDGPQPADRPDDATATEKTATEGTATEAADDVVDAEVVAPLVPAPAPAAPTPAPDYDDRGVPSLDYVRDKIEGRYAHSLGSTELAEETPEVKSFAEQAAKREEAAKDRLAAIRRSLSGDSPS